MLAKMGSPKSAALLSDGLVTVLLAVAFGSTAAAAASAENRTQ